MAPSEIEAGQSQQSDIHPTTYRYEDLSAAKVFVHITPPEHIQTAINGIITAVVSPERKSKIRLIAQKLKVDNFKMVKQHIREDDFLQPLQTALTALVPEQCINRNANWRAELKPVAPPKTCLDSSFISNTQQPEVDDALAPMSKRRQLPAGERHSSPGSSTTKSAISTGSSGSTAIRSGSKASIRPIRTTKNTAPGPYIKTPRPDFSMGIEREALTSSLSSQNLHSNKANEVLKSLQNRMFQFEAGKPLEPPLISAPTSLTSDLTFPFAVVEGKAYSTGNQIFEAQNQAAVTGACALKIQLSLNNLVDRGVIGSDPQLTTSEHEPLLFFAVCTEGPIYEIWAHWTVVEDDVRMFGSTLLDNCNMILLEQGENFLVKLDNICTWGNGSFVTSVVDRLKKVAERIIPSY
ncbi:MAG: hypothetical protein M1820_004978 [Bogoriella megaspora]|nr:MAG: hypothetical protein M1820_004978 [Bogoriella megaspora]